MPRMSDFQRGTFYPPVSCGLWILLLGLGVFFMVMLFFQVLAVGFSRLGLGPEQVLLVIMASFFGSGINIPVKQLESESTEAIKFPSFFGMQYRVPVQQKRKTTLAVNVGGCVVPVLVSLYVLISLPQIIAPTLASVAACAAFIYSIARPIKGMGVATPFFAPPLAGALLAIVVAPDGLAAPVAYVTGSLGTLIGADLLNLGKIAKLGAPVASIGGAGTWDGIFLAGLLASLLAF